MPDGALVVQAREIFDKKPREAAQSLIPLEASTRALVIGKAFSLKLEGVHSDHAEDAKEKAGRHLERVIDEFDNARETIRELIEAGDTVLVLAMLAGNAGEISTTAEVLDAELLAEFFDKDAEMNSKIAFARDARIINVCWTLIMETKPETKGVNEFFLKTDMGLALTKELEYLAGFGATRDETIDEILKALRDRRQFVVEVTAEIGDHETEDLISEMTREISTKDNSDPSDADGQEDEETLE